MNKKLVLALMLAASLAACQKKDDAGANTTLERLNPSQTSSSNAASQSASAPAAAAAHKVASPTTATPAASTVAANDAGPVAVTAPDLAYSYDYNVQAPARDVPHLVREHESDCAMAGSTVCQVVGATTKSAGEDDVTGRLEIRATPDWIAAFRGRIEADVKSFGGKISAADTGTDDLSRALVDNQAAIRAKTELRDRLEGLLKHHKGKLEDLVSLEQQVAQIQGEIDAANSEVAVMKTRVQTQKLVIEYSSMSALGPDSDLHPVAQAAHGFTRHFMIVVGALVNILSVTLPFGVIGAAVAWFALKRRRPVKVISEHPLA